MRVKEQRVQVAVAPLVGAWIERDVYDKKTDKYYVAPLVGAWIESNYIYKEVQIFYRRSSCRSVD